MIQKNTHSSREVKFLEVKILVSNFFASLLLLCDTGQGLQVYYMAHDETTSAQFSHIDRYNEMEYPDT